MREVFDRELRQGQIQRVDVTRDCSILAVVGDGMAGTPGIAAKLFNALGTSGVNVRAIAQGASERNISVVIDAAQTARALGSVHASFYLSPHTMSIGLIGPGLVGSAFLDQLASQAERLTREFRLDLRLRGVLTSKKMLLADTSVPMARWREALDSGGPPDLPRFVRHVDAVHLPHAVIVDCTASAEIARHYPEWLAAGIHVVTPNKQAGSADMAFYRTLAEARRAGGSHYLYEATVGAGLPIIQTVRDLRETGDRIQAIEGVLSGTLSYLFNVWDGEQPFSALVRDAKAQGFTEPDPRDDLSGTDVARKLIILAREMGLDLELADVELEGLVPESLRSATAEEFLARVPEVDAAMRERFEAARARGQVLRYVGRLDADSRRATVGPGRSRPVAFPREHQPDRQRGQLHDEPLQPQSARRARPRRRPGGHGRRRLRRSAARLRLPRRAAVRPLVHALAFAPASVGNVAVGFDVLGYSASFTGDRVRAERMPTRGVRIAAITGVVTDLPLAFERNTAGVAVAAMAEALGLDFGFELTIEKGIPLGSGLGGSAASAVAAVVAANALLDRPLDNLRLLKFAMQGELVASGTAHIDNIAPSLYGGLVLCGRDRQPAHQADPGAVDRALRARAAAPRSSRRAAPGRFSAAPSRCRTSSGSRPTSRDSSPAASPPICR